ncbi:MAG TPA: hypothetical protein VH143_09035 [Kofleriaceae bacterium]|jgi:hypothetical protein|nr:hypothetical protein [Kofleriaceae bacterium]
MLEIGRLRISRELISHPLLGRAHVIGDDRGEPITAISELDWDRPTMIPAIAAPGRLPLGEGARLLNAIAARARDAGVTALRYAGPYPTPALFRTLARSFRTAATESEFTRDLLARAASLSRDEIPIDFAPAPHVRVDFARGWSELRDGEPSPTNVGRAASPQAIRSTIERAVIDGTSFEPDGSPGRLIDRRAEIWFGDAPYAQIATLAPGGALIDGPNAPPALQSAVIGREFPAELREAIAELVGDAVPALVAADARTVVAATPIEWADLGVRAARKTERGFAVHAAIWERVAPHGLARVALAIAEALAPVVTSDIIARL